MKTRYPRQAQLIDAPADVDGYVAASHYPKSVSSNAFELRHRPTGQALAKPQAHVSLDMSTQERGILRGIISLLEMCSNNCNLNLYTTSQVVVDTLKGKHARQANLDLLDELFRIKREKGIDLNPVYVMARQVRHWVVLEKLKLMARDARDTWSAENGGLPGHPG